MKKQFNLFRSCQMGNALGAVIVLALAGVAAPSAQAATQTWDNGTGNFTWDTASLNWGGQAWTNNNDAVFGAVGVGSVLVDTGVIVNDLALSAAGYVFSGDLTLASDGASTITTTAAATISATLTGAAALNKAGAAALTLSGANDYSGGTTVTGILLAASDTALGSGAVTVNNGTGNQLQLGNGVNVANALTINGGGVTGQGVLHLPAGNATYSGTIQVTAAQNAGGIFATAANTSVLTIAGDNTITSALPIYVRSGTVLITGSQSYTGGTASNTADSRAMIQFAKPQSMPATGTVNLLSGTSLAVNVGGAGEFSATGTGAGTIAGLLAGTGGQGGPVTMATGSSLGIDTTNAPGIVILGDAYTSTNNIGLLKLGLGTLELTGGGTVAGAGAAAFPLVVRQGMLVLNGGTVTSNGETVVGGVFASGNGSAGLDATLRVVAGKLDVNGWLSVGRGNGLGGVSSDLIATNDAIIEADNLSAGFNGGNAANLPKGRITLADTSSLSLTANGTFHLAESAGSDMTMTLNDSASVTLNGNPAGDNARNIGNLGTGTLHINGNASFTDAATRFLNVGNQNGTGVINLNGGSFSHPNGEVRVGTSSVSGAYTGTGTINQSGGTATVGALTVGRGNNNQALVNGTVTVTGGTFTSTGDVVLGFAGAGNTGTLQVAGGTFHVATTTTRWLQVGVWDTSRGVLNVSAGNLNLNANSSIKMNRQAGTGLNLINITGGAVTFFSDHATTVGGTGNLDLQYAGVAASNNTVNLNGGTLTVPSVISTQTTGTRTFNFAGGTLRAAANNAGFFNLGAGNAFANVRDGGAIIDTNGYAVTIPQALLHSNIEGDAETDGGLTKRGAGNLTLTGTSSYTGPTTIEGGTLTFSGTGAASFSSGITIAGSGAKLVHISSTAIGAPVVLTQGALDGNGVISSLVVANAAGNTIGAGNGAAGALLFDSLTFNGAATLNLRANGTQPDQYLDTLALATSAAGKVTIHVTNAAGAWTSGTVYPLIVFQSYPSVPNASHFMLGDVPGLNPNQSAQLVNTGSAIALSVTGESLVWTGNVSSDWTTTPVGGARNWSYLGSGIEFSTNSPVVFGDTATRFTVNLAENVSPSAIVFENVANDYTVASAGGFGIATGTLVKNGSGKLTITTNNSSTGTVTINGGVLEVSGGGSVSASSAITNNATLVLAPTGGPSVYANPITGAGAVVKQGAGTLTLAGANTFTGSLTLEAGALNFNSATALGAGPGAFVINGGSLNNTSGADLVATANKPQTWNSDFIFSGTHSLAMGNGTVTLAGAGGTRTVTVAANTLRVGPLAGTSLTKTGPGMLIINHGATGTISGMLTIQQGIVGTSEDLYGGGITGPGILQNSGLTGTKWLYQTINSELTTATEIRNNDGTNTFQLGIVKRGTGTWTLTNNANNATSNLVVDNGKLILDNTGIYGSRANDGGVVTNLTSAIGNTAAGNGVLVINGATVNYNNRSNPGEEPWRGTVAIGNNGTGAGAVKFTAGTLTLNRQLGVGVASGSFGAFSQTGGTTTVGGFLATAFGTAQAVFNLSGGSYTQTAGPVTNGVAGIGVMNISGTAVYNQNGGADNGIWLGENGTGIMNVSGNAAVNMVVENNGIQLGRNAAGVGVLNLTGGTVTTKAIYKGAGAGTMNFNGGTLRANQANAGFLTGLDGAWVHAGGGTIDNGGFGITIGQPLLAPTGNGVNAAGLMVGGGGFIDTPVVTVTGDGTGATAVAQVDANGNLTGITMTNPGRDYTTPPAFALLGGGIGNTGGIDGSATLAPNTSGDLAFTGAGITTLTGVNTYTGHTTVGTGTTLVLGATGGLKFAPGANGVCNKVTGPGTAYLYGAFTIDLSGAAVANGNSWTLVDTASKTFDLLSFSVAGFTETSQGMHQLVDGHNTWTFTEATGKLTLSVAGASGYGVWITGFGLAAADQDPEDDPDKDGYSNLMEYALGGNPNSPNSPKPASGQKVGGNFVLTFTRNDVALAAGDVMLQIEFGNNLVGWGAPVTVPASNGTVGGVTFQITDGSPNDAVIATIPTGGATKFFARVKAVK